MDQSVFINQIFFVFICMQYQVRPLLSILTSNPNDKRVLDIPYNYSFPEIQQLLIFLHPSIQYLGLDFQSTTEQILGEMLKHKKKLKTSYTIKGKDEQQRHQYRFVSGLEYEWVNWELNLMVPVFKEDPADKKSAKNLLRKFISDSLFMISSQNKNLSDADELDFNEARKCNFRIAVHNYAEYLNQDKIIEQQAKKIFIGKLISGFFMSKKEKMKVGLMKQILIKDISQSVYTMNKSGLLYREIKLIDGVIPVQNFMQNKNDKDEFFSKFVQKISKKKLLIDATQVKNQVTVPREQKNGGQQLGKNNMMTLLLTALIAVVLIYFYTKITGDSPSQAQNL